MIHSTAIIHPSAQLHESVRVGPYSVIDEHVTVGAECELAPHVHLTGHTTIGAENRFHTGCVIGDAPQDLKYGGEPTRLIICLLYTSPSPRDATLSRMPSSA